MKGSFLESIRWFKSHQPPLIYIVYTYNEIGSSNLLNLIATNDQTGKSKPRHDLVEVR